MTASLESHSPFNAALKRTLRSNCLVCGNWLKCDGLRSADGVSLVLLVS